MVLFFTVTLGISIVGMSALLALKHFEMTTGRVVLGEARPGIGAFFHRGLVWVERDLPTGLSVIAGKAVVLGKKVLHHAVARSILALERGLEWALGLLRHTTTPTQQGTGEVSAFLREVAEHKKKLLKRSSSRTSREK